MSTDLLKLAADIEAKELRARAVGTVDGKIFSDHMPTVKELKKAGRLAEAEALLLRLQAAAEAWGAITGYGTPPWYESQLRIVRKKLGR